MITDEQYFSIYQDLKQSLLQDPNTPTRVICERHGVSSVKFRKWLERKNLTMQMIHEEVNSMRDPDVECPMRPIDVYYQEYLNLYKDKLHADPFLSFDSFCNEFDVNRRGFSHWIRRIAKTNISAIKNAIQDELGVKAPKKKDSQEASEAAENLFCKIWAGYNRALSKCPTISLSSYCRSKGVDQKKMHHWVEQRGLSVRKAQDLGKERRSPGKSKVFVSFQPTGGKDSDVLKGITIKTPDGYAINLNECTVIGLCSFVMMYEKEFRNKK